MSTLHASCVALLTYFTVWNRYHALDANMVRNIVVCGQHGGLLPFLDNLDGADARPSWVMVANSTETRAVASAVGGGMSPPVGDIGGLDSGAFPPAPQGPAVHTTCSVGGVRSTSTRDWSVTSSCVSTTPALLAASLYEIEYVSAPSVSAASTVYVTTKVKLSGAEKVQMFTGC